MPYIKVMPGFFLSFEAFVLFAQAPDEGNEKLTGIYSGHTWVCVMVKLILPEKEIYGATLSYFL